MKRSYSWEEVHAWLVFIAGLASVLGLILLPLKPDLYTSFLAYIILVVDIPSYAVISLALGSLFVYTHKKWESGEHAWKIDYGMALAGLGLTLYVVFVLAFMFPPIG